MSYIYDERARLYVAEPHLIPGTPPYIAAMFRGYDAVRRAEEILRAAENTDTTNERELE